MSELEKEVEEYDLIIRFKSDKPKYEIRDHIIKYTLDEFDNLQMWDFKKSSEFAELRDKRIAELETQINGMKTELHHRLVDFSRDDSDCLDKIIGLDRLWQFGQEF